MASPHFAASLLTAAFSYHFIKILLPQCIRYIRVEIQTTRPPLKNKGGPKATLVLIGKY